MFSMKLKLKKVQFDNYDIYETCVHYQENGNDFGGWM